jgi:hypothetical protein
MVVSSNSGAISAWHDAWIRKVAYVTESSVDTRTFVDGALRRREVELLRPNGNAELVLCRFERIRLDDLSVEEIAAKDVPYVSAFREVFERYRHTRKPLRDFVVPELREYALGSDPVDMSWYPPGGKDFPLYVKRQGHRGSGPIHFRKPPGDN